MEDKLVFKDEMPEAAAFVSDAKNQLRNRSGYSPRQWVFGSNGRQPQDLLDADSQDLEAMDLASPDTKFARTQVLRVGAKAAFFACQSKEAVHMGYQQQTSCRQQGLPGWRPGVCLERSGTRKREET